MTIKSRLEKLEKRRREHADAGEWWKPRLVNYRAGIDPNIPDAADAIPVRWVEWKGEVENEHKEQA